jgi:three-Cys-motif partner protein
MEEHAFGGNWTEIKLDKLRKYLPAYMNVLKGKGFKIGYIDAFAGTGYRTIRTDCTDVNGLFDELDTPEVRDYLDGSARIALQIESPFDSYIFVEKDERKAAILSGLKDEFPNLAERISIKNGDANQEILAMCASGKDWKRHRAVMFLDPFGMQVEWNTIQAIASTEAIDLWYLFSIGSVNRLLEKRKGAHPEFAACLDRVLGAKDWREAFYKQSGELSLFEDESMNEQKEADFSSIGEYIVKRLGSVFPGVVKEPFILRNTKNSPLFMLCFAVGNPNPKAKETALKIARDILMKD